MKIIYYILAVYLTTVLSCNPTEPPEPDNRKLTLTFEDASCTEAWIKLTTTNLQLPTYITLKQDEQTRSIINLIKADTLLYVDSLLPNKTYTFQAFIQPFNQSQIGSNEVTATTMDTTSHNFIWQSFTFGEAGSSVLNDVAIINENNIWAVGEIFMNDSLGNPDPNIYNAVHWDGSEWEPRKITVLYNGNLITPPLYGIFAFSESEIWLSSGVPIKGDGYNWTQYHLFDMGILNQNDGYLTKIWGTSSSDLFYVGTLGTIAHYSDSQWRRIESGTDVDIQDIWGQYNTITAPKNILCAVSNRVTAGVYKILTIKENNSIDSITWNTNRRVQSVWFEDNLKIFACGGGVFINNGDDFWQEQLEVPLISTNRIRGIAKNDVFVGGDFGLLAHFNGVNWMVYQEANVALFYSLNYKGNVLTAVGERNGKAVILIMRRQ